jgi:SHS2 domain-containing protein
MSSIGLYVAGSLLMQISIGPRILGDLPALAEVAYALAFLVHISIGARNFQIGEAVTDATPCPFSWADDGWRWEPVLTDRFWEHFPHEADVGIRGVGPTPAAAFEQGALALTAVVTHADVEPVTAVEVSCDAPDIELLFVAWLNAIIFEMATRRTLFGRFEVKIEGTHLEGILWGEPVNVERHQPACEPKGATYTALKVAKEADGRWSAACVVDV